MKCPHCGSRGIVEAVREHAFYVAMVIFAVLGVIERVFGR